MNQPADDLRFWFRTSKPKGRIQDQYMAWLDEALAAERRATVKRIRLGLASAGFGKDGYDIEETHAILDEEAAR